MLMLWGTERGPFFGGVFLVLEKIKNKRSAPQARKKRREEEGEERGEEEEGRRDFTEPLAACARHRMLRIERISTFAACDVTAARKRTHEGY